MRNASALSRFVATMIAVGVVLVGCGQTPFSPAPDADSFDTGSSRPVFRRPHSGVASDFQSGGGGQWSRCTGGRRGPPRRLGSVPLSILRICRAVPFTAILPMAAMRSLSRTPATLRCSSATRSRNRPMGGPGRAWQRRGTRSSSAAGAAQAMWRPTASPVTTSTRSIAATGNSPYGTPPLVVLEGGGNDAARGASNAQIVANAERLIASIEQRYPAARVLMVGTLARGAHYGGGRRTEVDTLLGQVAGPARAAVRQRGRLAYPVQTHGLDGGRRSPEHSKATRPSAPFSASSSSRWGLNTGTPIRSPACPTSARPARTGPLAFFLFQTCTSKRTTKEPVAAKRGRPPAPY